MRSLPVISLDDFQYPLPPERIAQYPVSPRDHSKLLVYDQGIQAEKSFYDLPQFLPEDTLLVFNDTKVIPARLIFQRASGAVIEVFLLQPMLPSPVISEVMESTGTCSWDCMIGNRKKWKEEFLELTLPSGILLKAYRPNDDSQQVRLEWNQPVSFAEVIREAGQIPLPPYLQRPVEAADADHYQTLYAQNDGAVAAPTAGLHFTPNVLDSLTEKGIDFGFVTLHVGAGTFQPVKAANALDHTMHNEQMVFELSFLEKLVQHQGRIVPVGTTSMRSIESLYWYGVQLYFSKQNGEMAPPTFLVEKLVAFQDYPSALPSLSEAVQAVIDVMKKNQWKTLVGETEIFIFPGYPFRVCDGLVTNFHQPGSTLILLIAALIGPEWRSVYQHALENQYRFLSFGDSSLLWKSPLNSF